jgi:hypothetical protein
MSLKLSTVVKPRKMTGTSQQAIKNKFSSSGITFSNHGSNIMIQGTGDRKTVIAFNFEKRRPVKRQLKTSYKGLKGNINKTKVEQRGEWIGFVYRFPVALLDALNLQVVQNSRNFEIKAAR